MYKLKIYVLLVVIMWAGACSSSKKMLKQGNYYNAVLSAVDKLQRSPNNDKNRDVLRKAYPIAVDYLLNNAKNKHASNDPFKWSHTADYYQQINLMYEAIQRSPAAKQVIPNPKNYYQKYAEIKGNAAEEQYAAGEAAMRLDTRESAKDAYFNYLRADEYVPGYKDVQKKIAESKYIATLKVVVNQVELPSRFFKVSADFFQDQVENYFRSYTGQNEFVRFYSPQEAQKERVQADQILHLQFEDFNVGQTNTRQKEETITRDSVKVGEVEMEDGKKKPVYGEVSAKLITTHVEIISKGILGMQIQDAYNKATLSRQNFPGEYVWFADWATYKGDERALTPEQLNLCKSRSVNPPPPQQLFVEFTKPIYDQLVSQINRFYRGA